MNIYEFPEKLKKDNSKRFEIVQPRHDDCKHSRILINETLNEVECKDCHAKVSPFWVLLQQAKKESSFFSHLERLVERVKSLQGKLKTKCQHCNKFTPIKTSVRNL